MIIISFIISLYINSLSMAKNLNSLETILSNGTWLRLKVPVNNFRFYLSQLNWLKLSVITVTTFTSILVSIKLYKYFFSSDRRRRQRPPLNMTFDLLSARKRYPPSNCSNPNSDIFPELTNIVSDIMRHIQHENLCEDVDSGGYENGKDMRLSSNICSCQCRACEHCFLNCTLDGNIELGEQSDSAKLLDIVLVLIRKSSYILEEYRVKNSHGPDSREKYLDFIISKTKQLIVDVKDYRHETIDCDSDIDSDEVTPRGYDEHSSTSSIANTIRSTSTCFFDAEGGFKFNEIYELYNSTYETCDNVIPPRKMRTKQMGCASDREFLAKIDCLRYAFAVIFETQEHCEFFINIMRTVVTELLATSSDNVENNSECLTAIDETLKIATDLTVRESITAELRQININIFSFYDIVLDYIILDSIDWLADPPATILSITKNQYISKNFMETAVKDSVQAFFINNNTDEKCFINILRKIIGHVLPVIAWGTLGPCNSIASKRCCCIRDAIVGCITDLFNFERTRYTNMDDLMQDIVRNFDDRFENLKFELSVEN